MTSKIQFDKEERIKVLEQQLSDLREKNYFLENDVKNIREEKVKIPDDCGFYAGLGILDRSEI